MADISHTLTLSWARSGESIAQSVTVSADSESNFNVTVPATTTDMQVEVTLDVSQMAALYVHSDKDITLETNSGSAAAATITITANKPIVWFTGSGTTNPLGATDVTAVFLTNAGASDATVKFRALVDNTP